MISLINANALTIPLANESVHMCVTSPPYWGLRDYSVAGQLGLETTPEAYVASMVAVFREVWRVLRPDGTLWLNIGDSYTRSPGKGQKFIGGTFVGADTNGARTDIRPDIPAGLKEKDLVGIPWRLAFALQADGWWLRSDIIWSKPNPMPESVTDRPTKAHEYLFLLAKSASYYYDADAVREEAQDRPQPRPEDKQISPNGFTPWLDNRYAPGASGYGHNPVGRNRRTVWEIATAPYSGAHFATFPPALVEPCIKAGCPFGGIVLDPFAGSGTMLMVARQLGRSAIGLDLSLPYLRDQARARLGFTALDEWTQGKKDGASVDDLPLFKEIK